MSTVVRNPHRCFHLKLREQCRPESRCSLGLVTKASSRGLRYHPRLRQTHRTKVMSTLFSSYALP